MSKKPDVGTFPIRERLPTSYYTEIGRIIYAASQVERQLSSITYRALGVGKKQGRLAVLQKRPHEQLYLIRDLAELRDVSLGVKWKTLYAALKQLDSFRNRLAHGLWLKHPETNTPVLQDFSTAYVTNVEPGTKPKINPLAVEVHPSTLRDIREQGFELIKILKKLEAQVHARLKP